MTELEKIYKNNIDEQWQYLIDNGYFTEKELQLVTNINGYNIETINDCIYARYGYRDIFQLMED